MLMKLLHIALKLLENNFNCDVTTATKVWMLSVSGKCQFNCLIMVVISVQYLLQIWPLFWSLCFDMWIYKMSDSYFICCSTFERDEIMTDIILPSNQCYCYISIQYSRFNISSQLHLDHIWGGCICYMYLQFFIILNIFT